MTWYDRIAFDRCKSSTDTGQSNAERMGPGLSGEYDLELREKAAVSHPPPPPDCMGVEGEYDPCGLVKRVAEVLDDNSAFDQLDSLNLYQDGGKVVFEGTVPKSSTLKSLVDCASRVDGTHAVEISQVSVERPGL